MPKHYKKGKLTAKERTFVRELTKGATQRDAAIVAYPDNKNPDQAGYAVATRIAEKFPEVMERVGITDDLIAETIKAGMVAKTSYYSKSAQDFVTVDDWNARLKAADMGLKLKRHYPKVEAEVEHSHTFIVTRGQTAPVVVEKIEAGTTPTE